MSLLSLARAARVNSTVKDRYTTRGTCFYAGYPNPYIRGTGQGIPLASEQKVYELAVGRKGKVVSWMLVDKS